jgi:hypothetical protein
MRSLSRTIEPMSTTLAQALPCAEFLEQHTAVVDAPPERVWVALHETLWSDLVLTRPFLVLRGTAAAGLGRRLVDDGPVQMVTSDEPRYLAGGRVAKPWRPVPEVGPAIASLDDLAAFDEPGWLKMGLDFSLHGLPGGRTRLDTSTLCEPTDDEARRRFGRYWRLIRPFSGLIRRDMLRAVTSRALSSPAPGR